MIDKALDDLARPMANIAKLTFAPWAIDPDGEIAGQNLFAGDSLIAIAQELEPEHAAFIAGLFNAYQAGELITRKEHEAAMAEFATPDGIMKSLCDLLDNADPDVLPWAMKWMGDLSQALEAAIADPITGSAILAAVREEYAA